MSGGEDEDPVRPGEVIAGKYHLEKPLAHGGMGSVWRARHVDLLGCEVLFYCPTTEQRTPSVKREKRRKIAACRRSGAAPPPSSQTFCARRARWRSLSHPAISAARKRVKL